MADERLSVQRLSQSSAFLAQTDSEMSQIDLGEVEVLPKDSVSLEDVDVYQVPRDLDIVLTPRKKRVVMLGQKTGVAQQSREDSIFPVEKELFEEKSFEEH